MIEDFESKPEVQYVSSVESYEKSESNQVNSEKLSSAASEKLLKEKCLAVLTMKKLFEKVEDRPTPLAVYNWRVYGMGIVASTAAIIIGYDGGFIGGTVAMDSFKQRFNLSGDAHSDYIISNVISVFHVGCFFGALISYPFSYYWGRRIPLMVAALLITAGSGIMLACSREESGLGPLYAGRTIAGLGIGFSTNLTPVYLSEISPPAVRGRIIAMFEIGWRFGDLIGFWINYGISQHIPFSDKQWIIPFAVQLIPAGMFFVGSFVMIESPRWLFSVNRTEKAMENLCWLRNLPADNDYIIYEAEQVQLSIERQKSTVGLGLMDPFRQVFDFSDMRILYRLSLSCSLFLFQNFLGIQSINYYSPKIFSSLGVKGTNSTLLSTGLFGVVKFVCTFLYILVVVDNFGRRKPFIISSCICSICFWYIGGYLKVNDPTQPGVDAGPGGTAAIAMMYIWIASFILAWSGGPFIVGSEIFDQNIRSFVQSINAAVSWVPIFIMSRWTTNMIRTMHYGIYFFFASLAVLSIVFVFFCIPETKGIALEDMDRLFDPKLPARRAHKVVMAHARHEARFQIDGN